MEPREGVDWGAGHVAANGFGGNDAEALAHTNLRQPEPYGLTTPHNERMDDCARNDFPELGEGLWDKGHINQGRRGGGGVNKNSRRTSKSFLLRPDPTGGSASL